MEALVSNKIGGRSNRGGERSASFFFSPPYFFLLQIRNDVVAKISRREDEAACGGFVSLPVGSGLLLVQTDALFRLVDLEAFPAIRRFNGAAKRNIAGKPAFDVFDANG